MTRHDFPFAAIVGLKRSKHALMLLAVDPGLKGVLIASPPGAGKSLLARSFRSILPKTGSDPGHSAGKEMGVRAPLNQDSALIYAGAAAPILEVPIGVTEDMLVGGIDFASTLAVGSKRVSPGLLARADGGFICVDHIDLLDSVNLRHLLTALDCGFVAIERDGISSRHAARFALIGTLGTWDTETRAILQDRVGVVVEEYGAPSEAERGEIIYRAERFIRDPARFCIGFARQTKKLRLDVLSARSRLSSINVDRSYVFRLSSAALNLGIQSSRADLFAVRAARASAALRGALEVEEADLIAAIEYVLLPRAGTRVQQQGVTSYPRAATDDDLASDQRESQGRDPGDAPGPNAEMKEVVLQARDCPVPGELADSRLTRRDPHNKARAKSGRRAEQTGFAHGRYVAAVPAVGGHKHGKRIAIDATLRAAAPRQRIRRAAAARSGGIGLAPGAAGFQPAPKARGSRPSSPARSDPSPKGHADDRRVMIKAEDLRFKKLKHRSGSLFIFLVDTSGSMALGRIGHAKGVMIRMLRQAYLHRDRVALIAFRGTTVQVVLEPTSSLELARRAIESMPAGGGTPLGAGLVAAISLAEKTRKKMPGQVMLLVFTDGRVNVALRPVGSLGRMERDAVIRGELEAIGAQLRHQGIRPIVIDTSTWDVKAGRCASISEAIGARYCRLAGSGPDGLYERIVGE